MFSESRMQGTLRLSHCSSTDVVHRLRHRASNQNAVQRSLLILSPSVPSLPNDSPFHSDIPSSILYTFLQAWYKYSEVISNVKGKVVPLPFFLTKHDAMKAYWGVGV
jgi:hypothetical protein